MAFAENDFYPLKKEFTFIADAETLEGFLYPDTYALDPKNITPETIARTMLKNFQTKILPPPTSPLLSKEGESGEGVGGGFNYETLILASIVEKEERNSNERPTVAGILKKRLNE
ncbi:MAG: endolytic transglycosylase MltG [Candidatus Peribacteria bacterium]|nr:MAG: endolytic transglycosylase MltG [Candidatus Peribacteria bacterium]